MSEYREPAKLDVAPLPLRYVTQLFEAGPEKHQAAVARLNAWLSQLH